MMVVVVATMMMMMTNVEGGDRVLAKHNTRGPAAAVCVCPRK